jgi:hypothetical protein
LVAGAEISNAELIDFAKEHIHERAAHPKYIEVLPELPKTAVGKVFKPDLRRKAITRIYNAALADAKVGAKVTSVLEDKKLGLVACLEKEGDVTDEAVTAVLGSFTRPWRWDQA